MLRRGGQRGRGGGGCQLKDGPPKTRGGGEGDFAGATIGLRDPWWSPEVCRQMLPKLSLIYKGGQGRGMYVERGRV